MKSKREKSTAKIAAELAGDPSVEIEVLKLIQESRPKWTNREDKLPKAAERVLAFSPAYEQSDPMRWRIMDGEFIRIATDVKLWVSLESLVFL